MAKSTASKQKYSKQKYIVLERYQDRDNWDLFSVCSARDHAREFDTVDEAMAFIQKAILDDVDYYGDLEFKIAAINDDTIRFKKCVTCSLEIHKD